MKEKKQRWKEGKMNISFRLCLAPEGSAFFFPFIFFFRPLTGAKTSGSSTSEGLNKLYKAVPSFFGLSHTLAKDVKEVNLPLIQFIFDDFY